MAKRGTSKWFSIQQEERVAKAYCGTRSPSSGAAVTDAGDVRSKTQLIECKHRGTFLRPARSIALKLDDLEKIVDEGDAEGRMPVLALSLYCPDSPLANFDGYVDVACRPLLQDAEACWMDGASSF